MIENAFIDFCEAMDQEETDLNMALDTIYAQESLNSDFMLVTGMTEGVEADEDTDDFFSEAFGQKENPVMKAVKRTKDVLVKFIKNLIEQIKKFGRMMKDRINQFMVKVSFTNRLKEAEEAAQKAGSVVTKEIIDLQKYDKATMDFERQSIKFMREIVNLYKGKGISEADFNRFEDRYAKAKQKYETTVEDIARKTYRVKWMDAIRITKEYSKKIQDKTKMKELENTLNTIMREFEQAEFEFCKDRYEYYGAAIGANESADSSVSIFDKFIDEAFSKESGNGYDYTTAIQEGSEDYGEFTEATKEVVPPSRINALIQAISSTVRANVSKTITFFISLAGIVIGGGNVIVNSHNLRAYQKAKLSAGPNYGAASEEEAKLYKRHETESKIRVGVGSALGVAGITVANKTGRDLGNDIYANYKKARNMKAN